MKSSLIDVTPDTLADHPGVICFINPKHDSYHHKIDWLKKRFAEGLKIKLLYLEGEKKPAGFIEYVPGENCWRAVNAKGYLFIHCLWINGNKHKNRGLGRMLLEAAGEDAAGTAGMAVVTSDGSFMANRDVFIGNGYSVADESGMEQLLVKQFKKGPLPSINDWESELAKIKKFTMVYSKQCPWVARFIDEVKPILEKEKLEVAFKELTTPAEAQKGPSLYGTFSLIKDGRLLADRYISTTRFLNIVKKELKGG